MTIPRRGATAAATLVLAAALATAGCSATQEVSGPESAAATVLLHVEPEGGSTGVDPNANVTLEFSHPVNPTMSEYAVVHRDDLQGPEVPGTWSWSEDYTVLTFRPDRPFELATTYVIHVGGGLMDADGGHVGLGRHGSHMGGDWATGGMMGYGHGGAMAGGHGYGPHMGDGWEHPSNGSFGMVFRFTTAS